MAGPGRPRLPLEGKCNKGHNLAVFGYRDRNGWRICRACVQEKNSRNYHKQKRAREEKRLKNLARHLAFTRRNCPNTPKLKDELIFTKKTAEELPPEG